MATGLMNGKFALEKPQRQHAQAKNGHMETTKDEGAKLKWTIHYSKKHGVENMNVL